MNIRKPTDYTAMFAALDTLMAAQLPQMELYCEIGRLVSGRAEKGAAVAASEYLQAARLGWKFHFVCSRRCNKVGN